MRRMLCLIGAAAALLGLVILALSHLGLQAGRRLGVDPWRNLPTIEPGPMPPFRPSAGIGDGRSLGDAVDRHAPGG